MTTIAALPFLPDAVIFDMDGLMIDSERVSLACWSEAADAFGLGLDEAVFLRMVGLGDRDTHALLRAQGIEDSVIEAVAARCHELYEARTQTGLPLRPGILELLELLKAHAVPRAVATTTRQPRANRKLAAAGLLPYFDAVITSGDVARP
ncbi:HAD family hydrolase, partial [Stenotrophomonas maltophilia]